MEMGVLFNHLNFIKMKKFKILIPMMVFVMGISMAFTTKNNLDTGLWVQRDGIPIQLKSNPCVSDDPILCRVVFADDPNAVEHQVYTDQNFVNPKKGGAIDPYVIME